MSLKRRRILKQALNLGYGTDTIPADAGGTLTGDKIGLHTFNSGSAVNAMDKGATGNGSTDDFAAIMQAFDVSDNVYLPGNKTYLLSQPLTLGTGQCLFSDGYIDRWRGGFARAKLDYRGSTACIQIQTTSSGQVIDSVKLLGIHADGTNASGNVDGLLMQADTGGADVIELVHVEGCSFTNFPRNQVRSVRTVFRVVFRSCSFHNKDRAADHVIAARYDGTAGAPGQWTFDDCFGASYTAGKWFFHAGRDASDATTATNAISDVIFNGGTFGGAASGAGSHGVWVYGGLHIYGSHIQNFTESAQAATIGVRYTGSNGAIITPAICSFFGTGLEIGDSATPATEAIGCIVQSGVGNNLTAGKDVYVVGTGIRRGTVIFPMGNWVTSGSFGTATGLVNVTNSAATVGDVLQIQATAASTGYTKLGTQLNLDDNNSRIGVSVAPVLKFHVRTGNNDGIRVDNSANSNRIGAQMLNVAGVGEFSVYDSSEVQTMKMIGTGYIEGIEISDPAAPSTNAGRLYFRDNGASKTQLVVRFPTGAIQVIATEP